MPQNPIDKGVNRSFDLYSKLLQALAAPEIMKSEQAQRKAALENQNIINRFLPQQQQASLNQSAAQLPLTQAQTAEANQRTKLMPLQDLISAQNSLTAMGNAQRVAQNLGPAWTFLQLLGKKSPGDRAAWQANNADFYDKLVKQAMQESQQSLGKSSSPIESVLNKDTVNQILGLQGASSPEQEEQSIPSEQQGYQNAPSAGNQAASNSVPPRASPAPIVGGNLPGAPQGNNAAMDINPNEYKQALSTIIQYPDVNSGEAGSMESQRPVITIGDADSSNNWTPTQLGQWSEMEQANKSATGPQAQNRKQAAIAFANVTRNPKIQEAFVKLSDPKYSGMIGKSELYLKNKFKPADVAEYNSIKDRLHTLLSGSLKGLENIPTSNLGMERSSDFFKTIANDKAWVRDPQAQLQDTITAMSLADAEAEAIIKSAQPLFQTYKMPKGTPPILEKAMKEAQGNQKASQILKQSSSGTPSTKIPEFNSKEEFQTWYAQQSPEVKSELRRRGGQ